MGLVTGNIIIALSLILCKMYHCVYHCITAVFRCTLKVAFSSDFSKTWDSKRLGLKYTTNSELSHLTSVSFKGVEKSFMATFPSLFPVNCDSHIIVVNHLCVHTLAVVAPKETEMYHEAVGAVRRIGRD